MDGFVLQYKKKKLYCDKGLLEVCCNTIFVLWPTVTVNSKYE